VDVVVNMEALDPESIKLKVDKNRISGDYMTLFIRKTGERTFFLFNLKDDEFQLNANIRCCNDSCGELWPHHAPS